MSMPIDKIYDQCVSAGMPQLDKITAGSDDKAARVSKFLKMRLEEARAWGKLVKLLPPAFLLRMGDIDEMVATLGKLQLEEELT